MITIEIGRENLSSKTDYESVCIMSFKCMGITVTQVGRIAKCASCNQLGET